MTHSILERSVKYELFFGEFNGEIKTFTFSDGTRVILAKPVRVTKNFPYVFKYDTKTGMCTLLPCRDPEVPR